MKLSTKSRYGARAILEIARSFNKSPVKRKEISAKQGIPMPYLENILITLKNNGIINTIRGAHGGYSLARAPHLITMLDIINVLEGELVTVDCVGSSDYCTRTEMCVTRKVWQKLKAAQDEVLRNITIQDLLDDEVELAKDYQI